MAGLGARARSVWGASRSFVDARFPTTLPIALVEAARPAARHRAVTVAIAAFILGFILDDLRALRVPGFFVGITVAVVALGFGGAVASRSYARRVSELDPHHAYARLARRAVVERILLALAIIALVAWVALTAGGWRP